MQSRGGSSPLFPSVYRCYDNGITDVADYPGGAMETFIKITKKLYWLGGIGVIGILFDLSALKWFALFFLLGIVDFILSFFIVLRTKSEDETINDLKLLFQNLGMLLGIPIICFRNLFHLPDIKNYKPEMRYGLPFEGRWIVANGGITKEDSHSWNICNQRYAYDFYIQENGKTFCNSGK